MSENNAREQIAEELCTRVLQSWYLRSSKLHISRELSIPGSVS